MRQGFKIRLPALRAACCRLLIAFVITGFFLPFFHLIAAPHEHYYNLFKGEFFDVVQASPLTVSGSSTSGHSLQKKRVRSDDISVVAPHAGNVHLNYCETANGILLNQNCAAVLHVASINSETVSCRAFRVVHNSTRNLLNFAPKHSPPHF